MSYIRRVGRYYPYDSNRLQHTDVIWVYGYTTWTPSDGGGEAGYVNKSCELGVYTKDVLIDQRDTDYQKIGVNSVVAIGSNNVLNESMSYYCTCGFSQV